VKSDLWLTRAQVRAAIFQFTDSQLRRTRLFELLQACTWEQARVMAFAEHFRHLDYEFSRFLRAMA
jgi:hypothetical protein